MRRLVFLILLLAFLSGRGVGAQNTQQAGTPLPTTAPAAQPSSTIPKQQTIGSAKTVIRSETRLVQLNVIAQDRQRRAVEDLKLDDFTLLDNGKPQKIALFAVETASVASSLTDSGEKHVLPPNVFGNRLRHEDEPPGSVTVILFDALNTSFTDQAHARTQILRFLRQLQPQDHVAIYLLTNHLRVLNEFTQDSKSLLEAIARFQAFPSLLLANSSQPTATAADMGVHDATAAQHLAGMLNDLNSKLNDLADVDRVNITAQALEAIANHVAGIPGRKNLLWVSGAFPISISLTSNDNSPVSSQTQNFSPQLQRVARALNQSNLAIYPVDARGLMVNSEFDAGSAHPFSSRRPAINLGEGQAEQSTMELLARETGGRAYYNTNDIQGAIRRTLAEGRFTYSLGYYPDHGEWNGQYHKLELRVKKAGVALRYRKGYFALADPPENPGATHNALQAAAWSPVDSSSLGIEARIEAIYSVQRKLDLRVRVETGDLRLHDVDGRHLGSIDAIYLQLGATDKSLAIEPLTYKLDFSEKEYRAALQRGYELKAPLVIHPGTRNLRVVVRDAVSGVLGSVTIPLEKFLPPAEPAK